VVEEEVPSVGKGTMIQKSNSGLSRYCARSSNPVLLLLARVMIHGRGSALRRRRRALNKTMRPLKRHGVSNAMSSCRSHPNSGRLPCF